MKSVAVVKKQVTCVITHSDGNKEEIVLNHSYNKSQIQWFKHFDARTSCYCMWLCETHTTPV